MGIKNKTRANVVAVTCCDFGTPGRRDVICEHYSFSAACRAYQKHWEIYHRGPAEQGLKRARVWVEFVQPPGGNMAEGTGLLQEKT